MLAYLDQVIADIASAEAIARRLGATYDHRVDTIYFGGGTPSLLDADQLTRVVRAVRGEFDALEAEITVECAPNSISNATLAAMVENGVNRVSFGAQSFVDRETSSVARLHKSADTFRDVRRIRDAGIDNISIDLIAGLPRQTLDSWEYSLDQILTLNVPHCSIYMLEIDQGSRLGRELIAGGTRYHAHTVPDEDLVVDMYERACEKLDAAGIMQYEISNFARPGFESRHNLKYWQRDPYFGFGADAHSMLHSSDSAIAHDVRFATQEELVDFESVPDHYSVPIQHLNERQALEEAMIVGLRLNQGVSLAQLTLQYGEDPGDVFSTELAELIAIGLLVRDGDRVRLTPRGRLLSNEAFERFLGGEPRQLILDRV